MNLNSLTVPSMVIDRAWSYNGAELWWALAPGASIATTSAIRHVLFNATAPSLLPLSRYGFARRQVQHLFVRRAHARLGEDERLAIARGIGNDKLQVQPCSVVCCRPPLDDRRSIGRRHDRGNGAEQVPGLDDQG